MLVFVEMKCPRSTLTTKIPQRGKMCFQNIPTHSLLIKCFTSLLLIFFPFIIFNYLHRENPKADLNEGDMMVFVYKDSSNIRGMFNIEGSVI